MAMLTFASLSLFRSVLLVVLCLCCTGDARFKGFRRFVDRSEAIQHTARTGPKVEDHWFTQRLDHFNGADSRVWKQVSQCGSARPSQDLRSLALGGSSSAEDWGLKRRCLFLCRGTSSMTLSTDQEGRCFWWSGEKAPQTRPGCSTALGSPTQRS